MNGYRCETCGTGLIDQCHRCGAPQCCPKCCVEAYMSIAEDRKFMGTPETVLRNFANEFHSEISIRVEATEWGYGAVITMIGPESTATNVVTNKEAEELYAALGAFLKPQAVQS